MYSHKTSLLNHFSILLCAALGEPARSVLSVAGECVRGWIDTRYDEKSGVLVVMLPQHVACRFLSCVCVSVLN